IRTGRAPIAPIQLSRRAVAASSVIVPGASTHTMSSRTDAEAQSGPERSDPPIGWPPTNRPRPSGGAIASTSARIGALTLPTSVTTASGAAASTRATVEAMAGTGVHTNASEAPLTQAATPSAGSSPERSAARSRTERSTSNPRTRFPAREAAMAIDVPIRPVPRTATRSAEVIAKRLRAVQVHVGHLGLLTRRVEVHQHAHDPRHRPLDRDLL